MLTTHCKVINYIVSLSLLLLIISCNKDKNEPIHQEISDKEIEVILENGYQSYENFKRNMSSEKAKSEALKSLLTSNFVKSGEVFEQGLYLTLSDGSKVAILTDGQDAPEFNSVPTTPDREQTTNKSARIEKIQPAQAKTILLNPHYYERKVFADWLLERYNKYFPIAGYEAPEFYVNHECTVDRFASLDEYGIVHIYSHGIKLPDGSVYLMTGEKLNSATTLKYIDDVIEDNLRKIYVKELGTVYMLNPEFIKNQNDFSGKYTLIYGGFCHSYEGAWPMLCNIYNSAKSVAGYFGFDNSVYTDRNVKWAEDLFYNLSYQYYFEPEEAFNWRANSLIGNSYLNDEGETVKIMYIGDSDLKLWKWENTVWNRKYYDFKITVNARLQLQDGKFISKNNYLLYRCTGKGSFNRNTFTGKGYYYHGNDGRTSVGNIRLNVDPITFNIDSFTINDTTIIDLFGIIERERMQSRADSLFYSSTEDPWVDDAVFSLTGSQIKTFINELKYDYYLKKDTVISTQPLKVEELVRTQTLTDFSVDENSKAELKLLSSPPD